MNPWRTGWDPELTRLHPTMTQNQLAAHFGVSRSTLDKRCRFLGLRKGPRGPGTPLDLEDLKDMIVLQFSLRRMARETGKTRGHIKNRIKKLDGRFRYLAKYLEKK